jgi:FRG domain
MFDVIPVNSWEQLVSVLHDRSLVPSLPHSGNHFRSNYIFRGMVDASWPLRTSLQRLGSSPKSVETPLLRNFRKYSHPTAFYRDSIWELMSVAQHNGLPTRILDWTISPFVACHFATDDPRYKDVDGVIWCLDAGAIHSSLPDDLRKVLGGHTAWVFDIPMLDKLFSTTIAFDNYPTAEFVIIFEPPSIDPRIINQHGLLSVANSAEKSQDDIFLRLPDPKRCVKKIVIRAEAKSRIRDMLDQNNISERMLYPGLPGLCQWLKRYYSPA